MGYLVEIRAAEFLPLGDDQQDVGVCQCRHRRRRVREARAFADVPLRLFLRDRVVRDHRRAAVQQPFDDHAARRFAHVVRVGLEGEAPHRDLHPANVGAVATIELLEQHDFCASFASSTARRIRSDRPASSPVRSSAFTSFGKHEPP
jgi:hypothetical protein